MSDRLFTMTVIYEGSPYPGKFEHLTAEKAEQGIGAFVRDMARLPNSSLSKITIEREEGE